MWINNKQLEKNYKKEKHKSTKNKNEKQRKFEYTMDNKNFEKYV